ncbi:threonine synthase [Scatolibacter rhodanostii]|uniref:threonine synthase n=1 Tax=Scatolibacter rhodanostii TaxID=2014781 RepID=UPI000C074826|nr:threonine synthase [Scatolibacter rhodanostii]
MFYKSTRNPALRLKASEAIAQGLSDEGGLFVPMNLPNVKANFADWVNLSYQELAEEIFGIFLDDFTQAEIHDCVSQAYTAEKFGGKTPVKIVPLGSKDDHKWILELWHGPTCAFKDMALQILPRFLTVAQSKSGDDKEAVILVATSGDTGKAALEGFKDVSSTSIVVFYPDGGVSQVQKKQMATQEGENVTVCAVKGNFDDTQTGVKLIFNNPEMKDFLEKKNCFFSSANSINWGRLLPQVVYYFYTYFELYRKGAISDMNQEVNIAVPTGNFGNILAAFYANQMGLPVKKFICASNANNVLTDFISTGVYNRNRDFYTTTSPSMDILVSSNLERLLYSLSGENSEKLTEWMDALRTAGNYTVDGHTFKEVSSKFYGGFCTDEETASIIKNTFETKDYLADTHTAVAIGVYDRYAEETGDSTPVIIASTASPYKFSESVLPALGNQENMDEFAKIKKLEEISGVAAPTQIKELEKLSERFNTVIDKENMPDFVCETVTAKKGTV